MDSGCRIGNEGKKRDNNNGWLEIIQTEQRKVKRNQKIMKSKQKNREYRGSLTNHKTTGVKALGLRT